MTDCARIAILSADNHTVGHLDNTLPDALHFYDDKFVDYLEGAAGTLTFTVPAKHPEAEYIQAGNKLAFSYHDRDRYYTIIKAEPDEHEVHVTAYSLCLDLINETTGPYEASSAMTFAEYLAVFCDEDYMQININEVSTSSIQHTWDGSSTLLARLYSLANVFSAEVEFLPVLRADYTLDHIEVNVYMQHSDSAQGIGDARNDVVMRFGVNVQSIRKTTDISGLYTSIYATGKDGLTISSIARTVNDADGNVEFFTASGSPVLYAPQARDRYPSSVSEDGGYIQYSVSTDYETAEDLYAYMLGYLRRVCTPAVSYKVSGYEELNVGDTVRIIDAAFNPPLYLAARVSQQSWSMTQPERNETTFDNFTEMTAAIRESDPQTIDVVARTAARAANLQAFNAREKADDAAEAAAEADTKAVAARGVADAAKLAIETQEQFFWHDSSGAHISEVAEAASGKNVLINSYGMQILDGSDKLAEFKADEVSLMGDSLRMRAEVTGGSGSQQSNQAQFRKEVDEASATMREEFLIGLYRKQAGGTYTSNPIIVMRFDPNASSDNEMLMIRSNWVDIQNPGYGTDSKWSPGDYPGTRMNANGFRIVNEYVQYREISLGTNRTLYLARNGKFVELILHYAGAIASGTTSLGSVIPSGFRPHQRIITSSSKLINNTLTGLTNTTEALLIIAADGTITLLSSAAADTAWFFNTTVTFITGDSWPATPAS